MKEEGNGQMNGSVSFRGRRSRAPAGLAPRSEPRPGIHRLWCPFACRVSQASNLYKNLCAIFCLLLRICHTYLLWDGGLAQHAQLDTPRLLHPSNVVREWVFHPQAMLSWICAAHTFPLIFHIDSTLDCSFSTLKTHSSFKIDTSIFSVKLYLVTPGQPVSSLFYGPL